MFQGRFYRIALCIDALGLLGLISLPSYGTLPEDFWVIAPAVRMGFDTAGYSDWGYWDVSPRHPHGSHEMLSGEWAAAIWYDGIGTGDNAMWLTDWFSYPDWQTNSNFQQESYNSWDDPTNPISGLDTAQSIISNGQVRITIDYEMADLGEQGPDGEGGSPMVFYSHGQAKYVRSDRYVLLQTYTIKNITEDPRREHRILPDAPRPSRKRGGCSGLFDV